jgi:hypothetical protein
VDPGLVHTGLVRLELDDEAKRIVVKHAVVEGIDAEAVAGWVGEPSLVFVEKYVPRSHYGTDERMVQGERDLVRALPNAVPIRNFGVRQVVTPQLMQLLGVWRFSTRTNHDDLRSAARILLLGLMKHDLGNHMLATVVKDHLDEKDWEVVA